MRVIPPVIVASVLMLITGDSNGEVINKIPSNIKFADDLKLDLGLKLNYDPEIHKYIDNIYTFMLADLAIQREEIKVATNNLIQLLKNTNNPKIAEMLTELAIESNDYSLTSFAVQEWASLEPNNPDAQLIAVIMLLEQPLSIIEKFLVQAINSNPNIDTQIYNMLPQLNTLQKQLLAKHLKSLINKSPKDPIIYLCLANIEIQLNKIAAASKNLKTALKLKPNLTNAIILQAKLIKYKTKSNTLALNYLAKQTNIFLQNQELQIFYAHALFDSHKNKTALKVLQGINNSNNRNNQLESNLLTAEIYMHPKTLNLTKAKIHLNKLLNRNFINGKLYFLLAQIAEKESNLAKAIRFYNLIEDSPYHFIGHLRAALLLAENQQLNLAVDTLNQTTPETILEQKQLILLKTEFLIELQDLHAANNNLQQGLEILPNDTDLLYASSVVHSLNNEMLIAEDELNKIIALQPENHIALNALGFIISSDTERQLEALNYIEKALLLSPNNPMYMDNIGTLLHRMGKITDAISALSAAYEISNSMNIAIHLGEVLWAAGEKQKAKAIWEKAWKSNPNDLELVNVLNQYQVFFTKPT